MRFRVQKIMENVKICWLEKKLITFRRVNCMTDPQWRQWRSSLHGPISFTTRSIPSEILIHAATRL
jgi:hypothetical protein